LWSPSTRVTGGFQVYCFRKPLKVPSGQIESAWKWYHWKAL
jgi:hypothetical protein